MGFLKSLFGAKKNEPKVAISFQTNTNQGNQNQDISTNKVTSAVQDLVLLSIAEKYKVGEKKYPDYFRSKFGIGFPNEKFQALNKMGHIKPSTALETLPHLKAAELKAIASQFNLKVSGKKDEICSRIEESVPESDLDSIVAERYWIVTESGKALLDNNQYIAFYMDSHPYSLEIVGLDINTYANLFSNKSNCQVRDVIWGEFNRRLTDYYKKGITKGEFRDYCELLHTMALFLEEENRHEDSLAMYMRYIYYRANFDAGLSAIHEYSFLRKVDEASNRLFMDTEIYPFIADEIHTMIDACGFDSKQFQNYMEEAFSKEEDTGVFSPAQLSDLVMCGLNGDRDGQKDICKTAMKAAIKKIPK